MRNKTYATLTDLRSIKIRKTEDDRAKQQSLKFLKMLFGQVGGREVGVRLWDGTLWPDDAPRQVTLELKHPHALNAMFHDGTELALAEAYMFNDFDIVGDVERVFGLSSALAAATAGWRKQLQAAMMLRQMPRPPKHSEGRRGPAHLKGKPHSVERDRQAVAYHYNLSNDFYQLWLDRSMVYSCGYFRSLDQDIDTAQRQKLDYVCRKLRLRPGQRLLDIGCGWGGLAIHAATHYGVEVTGVTLSQAQADFAAARILEAKLSDRVHVRLCDYREIKPHTDRPFDALASVGMLEHVGAANLPVYFSQALQLWAWQFFRAGRN